MKRILRRNTKIIGMKFFTFPVSKHRHIGYAEARTDRGVKFFAYARQSVLDKYDEKMVTRVLKGKLDAILKIYRKGKSVRGTVGYCGMVPLRSSLIESRKLKKDDPWPPK